MTSLNRMMSIALRAAVLLVTTATFTFAQSRPTMQAVILNLGKNQIEVTGTNFGNALPTLNLNSTATNILSHSAQRIVAELPTQAEGHYTLTLTNHDATAGNQDNFSFDISDTNLKDQKDDATEATVFRPAVAPPSSLTLSGWANYSWGCPSGDNCQGWYTIPAGAQLVAGGCGAYYDAYSVYMVNSSPTSNAQYTCIVNNTDLVNGHTILVWAQWANTSAAGATSAPGHPTLFVIERPLSQ